MNKYLILFKEDIEIVSIIEATSLKEVKKILPYNEEYINDEEYQYRILEASGNEESPFMHNGCLQCSNYFPEFNGCGLNCNCDKDDNFWYKIKLDYFEGDEELANLYPASEKKNIKKIADFISVKSFDMSLYKIVKLSNINTFKVG